MENEPELNLPKEPPEEPEEKPPEEPEVKPPEGPREKPTPPREVRCPHCGTMIVPKVIKTPTGGERWTCPACTKLIPIPKERTPSEKKESVYRDEVDPNEILRNILEKHPDLSSKHIEEIMDWAQFGPIPPYLVTQLLGGMKDIKRHTAELIGHKYQMALQMSQGDKRPSLPPMMGMPQQQGGYNVPWSIPWPTPQTQQPPAYGFYQPPHQGYIPPNPNARGSNLSKEEVIEIVRARDKDKELEETKKELENLKKGGGTSSRGNTLTPEDLVKILEERDKRTIETFTKIMEERDKKEEEEKKERITEARFAALEQAAQQGAFSGKPPEEKEPSEEDKMMKSFLREVYNSAAERMKGKTLTADEIRSVVREEGEKLRPSIPPGSVGRYDAEIARWEHEAKAKMYDSDRRFEGLKYLGDSLRESFPSMGWNIGAGFSRGGSTPSRSPAQQSGTSTPVPQPITLEKDGLMHTKCPFCKAPIAFEAGKSTIQCGSCRKVIRVQATEEELKQKVPAEKSKAPETKVEAKKEEPKREEPQREGPQKEEKPSTEAKPDEKPATKDQPEKGG